MGDVIRVEAPARLHLGFIDLHGGLGRKFGSLGVALLGVETVLECSASKRFDAQGPDSELALRHARQLLAPYDSVGGIRLEVQKAIPRHAGLGSGTQMALAVGTAINRLYGLNLGLHDIALRLSRGLRSGIGIGAFAHGGFLIDGGRGTRSTPPPLLAHYSFPAHWRVVLLQVPEGSGLSGKPEHTAFANLPEFPADDASRLSRVVLMRILPALLEQDFEGFSLGVGELQQVVGDHFAPVQGGRFLHPQVRHALACAEQEGFRGIGQSSWGPTGFVLADSDTQAHALARDLRAQVPELSVRVLSAADHGHRLEVREEDTRQSARERNP